MKKDMTRSQQDRSLEIAHACIQAWANTNPDIIEYREWFCEWSLQIRHGDWQELITVELRIPRLADVEGQSLSKAPSYWRGIIKERVLTAYEKAVSKVRSYDRAKLPELVHPY